MTPRIALLALLPLLALQPALSNAAGQRDGFTEEQLAEQFHAAEAVARKAADDLVRSLEALKAAIPPYGLPYLDERGNIVIPRRPPALQSAPPERTRT